MQQIIINFLNSPIWSPLSTIIGIIALLIAILAYLRQKISKSLTFTIISNTPIMPTVDLGTTVSGKLQVLFDGKAIDNARLVIVRIWNSGNTPIKFDDYAKDSQLKLNFGEKSEILHSEVLETMPINVKDMIEEHFKFNKSIVVLGSPLLNKRDSITLKTIITNFDGQISMNTQIAGKLHYLEKFSNRTLSPIWGRGLYNLALSSATFGIFLFFFPTILSFLVLVVLIILILIIMPKH